MGFTFNGIHSDTFKISATTSVMPYIPSKRQTVIDVIGRDGQYVFEDGYNNIRVDISCSIGGYYMIERKKRAREISAWLAHTGILVLDSESDIAYTVVKVVNDLSANVAAREYRDDFTISFECEPHPKQTYYNNNLTWDDVDSSWPYTGIPWNGYERIFNVTSGQSISVVNVGTHTAYPLIKLTGVAEIVSIGPLIFTGVDGTVYIDCKNKLAYIQNGNSKINMINNLNGEFLELLPGANTFIVAGTITNLTVEFDYKNTYL